MKRRSRTPHPGQLEIVVAAVIVPRGLIVGPPTLANLLARREAIRDSLEANRRHVFALLREPLPEIKNLPVGDLLCWCEGLDEAAVSRVLAAAGVNWGRRVSQVSAKDQAGLLFQVKSRHPETWERWKGSLRPREAA